MMRLRVQPTEKRRLFDTSAWREWPYVYFVAGLFTTGLGIFIPIWYIQTYATQKSDISNDAASYLITILNSGAVAGRILPNFMSDKVGPLNMITPCTIIAGILFFLLDETLDRDFNYRLRHAVWIFFGSYCVSSASWVRQPDTSTQQYWNKDGDGICSDGIRAFNRATGGRSDLKFAWLCCLAGFRRISINCWWYMYVVCSY